MACLIYNHMICFKVVLFYPSHARPLILYSDLTNIYQMRPFPVISSEWIFVSEYSNLRNVIESWTEVS